MNRTPKHQHGFTLLEILIALFVFAIISSITASVLYQTFDTKKRVLSHMKRLAEIELALSLIESDTRQVVSGSLLNTDLFKGDSKEVSFISKRFVSPHITFKQSNLEKISYQCESGQLKRTSSSLFFDASNDNKRQKILLKNLKKCEISYLNHTLDMVPTWQQNNLQQSKLPLGLRLTLDIEKTGEMVLLFPFPGSETNGLKTL